MVFVWHRCLHVLAIFLISLTSKDKITWTLSRSLQIICFDFVHLWLTCVKILQRLIGGFTAEPIQADRGGFIELHSPIYGPPYYDRIPVCCPFFGFFFADIGLHSPHTWPDPYYQKKLVSPILALKCTKIAFQRAPKKFFCTQFEMRIHLHIF